MANLVLIRDLCEQRGITIRELGQSIDRDESTIHAIIRRGSTNTTTLELIAKKLKVSPSVFYDATPEQNEFAALKKEIEHLRALLQEKERTIAILMQDRK